MFTDEQIAKMTPKHHPAIIMAKSWGGAVSEEEYDKVFEEFKTWAYKTKDDIMEKYGVNSGEDFLDSFATSEIKPFFKAGFKFNYSYLDNLVKDCPIENGVSFLTQILSRKLRVVRESVTIIALNSNAIWGAKKEVNNTDLNLNLQEINKHTLNCLTFLATGKVSGVEFFANISKRMKEFSKEENPSTKTYIKTLKTLDKKLNEYYYDELHNGFLNNPQA